MLQPATVSRRRQVDEFGELAAFKRVARAQAARLGHALSVFTVRRQDRAKSNAWCTRCRRLAVVNTALDALPGLYGHALDTRCEGPRRG